MKEFYKVPTEEHRKLALGSLPGMPHSLKKQINRLLPFSEPLGKPKPGEWLYEHQEEGQTYNAYKGQMHNEVDQKRNVIYIKPLEEMSKEFIEILKEYCEAFFYPMAVKVLKTGGCLEKVAKRINPGTEKLQYNARDILKALKNKIKSDCFCELAVCMTDLYPRDEWNFVFGIASIRERIGVFSFARYDDRFYDQVKYEVDYDRILWNSLGVMSHEITHMFGVRHCIYYKCLMNGSNHLQESSSKPMNLCVVCLRKMQSNIKFNISERYKKMTQFVEKHGDKGVKGGGQKLKLYLDKVK